LAGWICATCGNHYPDSADPPASCVICADERQMAEVLAGAAQVGLLPLAHPGGDPGRSRRYSLLSVQFPHSCPGRQAESDNGSQFDRGDDREASPQCGERAESQAGHDRVSEKRESQESQPGENGENRAGVQYPPGPGDSHRSGQYC
jgi:hypothetical protein